MELQKSMAQMAEKLTHLAETARSQEDSIETLGSTMRDKIEKLDKDVHATKVLFSTIGTILTIVIAVGGSIAIPVLFKLLDVASALITKSNR